ncbi:TIM barrel protein [bacterium]|nr:TIM barrel protein [bacterium]
MSDPGKFSAEDDVALPSLDCDARLVMDYSINQITTCSSPFEADIAEWRHAGIPSIGLWRRKVDEIGEQQAVELIRSSGLNVTSVSFAGGFTGSSGFQFREALSDGYDALFLAAAVGANTVVIAPGSRGRYTERHERRLVVSAVRELAMAADDFGLTLALLPMERRFAGEWTSLTSLRCAAEMADDTGRDNVGIVFDTFQFGRSDRIVAILEHLATLIDLVQLSDSIAGPATMYDRLVPGEGDLPLADFLAALRENGFVGDVDVQVWSDAVWHRPITEVLAAVRSQVDQLLAVPTPASELPVSV